MSTNTKAILLIGGWVAFAVLVLCLIGVAASGQTPPVALPAGIDPNTAALLQVLQMMQQNQNGSTIAAPVAGGAISSVVAGGTVLMLARQFAPLLLGAPLSELKDSHARTRARAINTERELQRARIMLHWLAQCVTVVAAKLDCEIPAQPIIPPDPIEPLSDGN